MAGHVYHWKHGWIPLDHYAALSKSKGSEGGAARLLGKLYPVPQDHLPRHSNILAAHSGDGHFVLLDSHTGNTAKIDEGLAHSLFSNGHTIKGVEDGGRVRTEGPQSDTSLGVANVPSTLPAEWQKISPQDALGSPERDPRNNLPMTDQMRAKAASKVKQSYQMGNAKVVIEAPMNKAQTQALLADIADVMKRSGHSAPVTIHVPSGDRHFSTRKGRMTGAYVRDGQATIFLNPKVANGSVEEDAARRTALEKQMMPGAKDVTFRKWTIAHEMGHILDNHHEHTYAGQANRGKYDSGQRESEASYFREQQGYGQPGESGLSQYGKSNMKEGYAEVYAEFLLGSRSPIVESYMRRYGWI